MKSVACFVFKPKHTHQLTHISWLTVVVLLVCPVSHCTENSKNKLSQWWIRSVNARLTRPLHVNDVIVVVILCHTSVRGFMKKFYKLSSVFFICPTDSLTVCWMEWAVMMMRRRRRRFLAWTLWNKWACALCCQPAGGAAVSQTDALIWQHHHHHHRHWQDRHTCWLKSIQLRQKEEEEKRKEDRQTDEESESCRTKLKDLKRETGRGETDRVWAVWHEARGLNCPLPVCLPVCPPADMSSRAESKTGEFHFSSLRLVR